MPDIGAPLQTWKTASRTMSAAISRQTIPIAERRGGAPSPAAGRRRVDAVELPKETERLAFHPTPEPRVAGEQVSQRPTGIGRHEAIEIAPRQADREAREVEAA